MPKTNFSYYTLSQILAIFTSKTHLAWTKVVKETLKLELHVQIRRLDFVKEMYIMIDVNEGPQKFGACCAYSQQGRGSKD